MNKLLKQNFNITPEQNEMIKKIASARRISQSEVLRQIITDYLIFATRGIDKQ